MDKHTRHALWIARRWIRHQWDKAQFNALQQQAQKVYADGNYDAYIAVRVHMWHRWGV